MLAHYRGSNGRRARCLEPAVRSLLLISLSTILALSELDPSPTKQLTPELEEMKIQLTMLESILEDRSKLLDSRILELDQRQKMIEEMDEKIGSLQETLNDAKVSYDGCSVLNENIRAMEDEVQQLWDKTRRNNFNIHVSESKTLEAEKKMEEVASEVEKMQNIVNEQWIQIQRLEQSLQMTKVMTSRVSKKILSDGQKKGKSNGCPISQFRRIFSRHSYSKPVELPDSFFMGGSTPKFALLKATKEFKMIISAARKKHHELQYMVKEVMEMNGYTATLANREFIFFVTSAIIILPLMSAWVLLYPMFFGEPEW
ncbi:hypothetical protein KSP39_PZI011007 [Platanthera zijinensis]|uniref:Uncharacterized protein n=1 Tax=Platanthera zijinensis TaxID=2320716 RepID=A0AAP0BHL7_9ASPA